MCACACVRARACACVCVRACACVSAHALCKYLTDSFLFNAYCIFGDSAGSLSLLQLVIVMVLDCCVYLTYGLAGLYSVCVFA